VVINLCRNSRLANEIVESQFRDQKILDLPGSLEPSERTINLLDIDPGGTIETRAVNDFVDFIGQLSISPVGGKTLREFKIMRAPIFWFTPLAEKHDSYHWGKDIWLLRNLLLYKKNIFTGQSHVILSHSYRHIAPIVKTFFRNAHIAEPAIVLVGTSPGSYGFGSYFFDCCKNLIKAVRLVLKARKKKGLVTGDTKNIFVEKISSGADTSENIDLGEPYKLSRTLYETISVPYFDSYELNNKDISRYDQSYINSAPPIKNLVAIFSGQIKVWWQLWANRKNNIDIGNIRIPFSALIPEMLHGSNLLYFLNREWLKKYAASQKGSTKFFYSDEYYISGRVISAGINSANNSFVSSIGIQHGLLFENHSVYAISNNETGFHDALPTPDYFLVWGQYFKDLFLRFHAFDANRIIVSGNLKYRSLATLYKNSEKCGETKKILWCTTLPNFFQAEYAIVAPALRNFERYCLTIRLHPLGHIKKENVYQWVEKDILSQTSFSEEPVIFKDIADHDIIISTVFSTSYFDALVMGKISCRIVTNIVGANSADVRIRNLYNICSPDDFYNVLNNSHPQLPIEDSVISIDSLAYMNDDVWKKILSHA
jgi:hypothetical protein